MKRIITLILMSFFCLQMFGCGSINNFVVSKVTDEQIKQDLKLNNSDSSIEISHNLNKETMVDEITVVAKIEYTYGTSISTYMLHYYYNHNNKTWIFDKKTQLESDWELNEKAYRGTWYGGDAFEDIELHIEKLDFKNKKVVCSYVIDSVAWGLFDGSGTFELVERYNGYYIMIDCFETSIIAGEIEGTQTRIVEFIPTSGLKYDRDEMVKQ